MLNTIGGFFANNALALAAGAVVGAFVWNTLIPLVIRKILIPAAIRFIPGNIDHFVDAIQKSKPKTGKATRELLIKTFEASIKALQEDDGTK